MSTYAPFAKPLYVMLKPVGAVCNLACDYCYYLEKSRLYQENPKHVMSDELLEKFIEQYINSQTMPQVLFIRRKRNRDDIHHWKQAYKPEKDQNSLSTKKQWSCRRNMLVEEA